MNYYDAARIRKKGFANLMTDKLASGQGIVSSLRDTMSDRSKAKSMAMKERFDPMNIAKFLTGGSTLAPAIVGRLTGRSKEDIGYFAGKRQYQYTPRQSSYWQKYNSPNMGGGGSKKATQILEKIVSFMEKSREDDIKEQDTLDSYNELNEYIKQDNHKEVVNVFKEAIKNKRKAMKHMAKEAKKRQTQDGTPVPSAPRTKPSAPTTAPTKPSAPTTAPTKPSAPTTAPAKDAADAAAAAKKAKDAADAAAAAKKAKDAADAAAAAKKAKDAADAAAAAKKAKDAKDAADAAAAAKKAKDAKDAADAAAAAKKAKDAKDAADAKRIKDAADAKKAADTAKKQETAPPAPPTAAPAPPVVTPKPPSVKPAISEAAKTAAKVVTGTALGVIASKEVFAQTMLPQAQKASQKLSGGKIPPEALVAQWALESGWGRSLSGDYNYFGTKADKSWKGDRKLVTTREYFTEDQAKKFLSLGDGREILGIIGPGKKPGTQEYRVKDWFRSYKSLEEAVDDKTKFLIENTRYSKAGVLDATTSQEYFQRLQNAGYAGTSNVTYASTLMGVVPSVNKLMQSQKDNSTLKEEAKKTSNTGAAAPMVNQNNITNRQRNVTVTSPPVEELNPRMRR